MSSKITQKLWSRTWGSATPFAGFTSRSRTSRLPSILDHAQQRQYVWSRPRIQGRWLTVKKGFTSASILFIDIPSTATISSTVTSSANAAEKSFISACTIPRQSTASLTQQVWQRTTNSGNGRRIAISTKRHKSTLSNEQSTKKVQEDKTKATEKKSEPKVEEQPESGINAYLHLPHLHRPTKEEFLAAATGFWSRLKARFKWFSIRSSRPWNIDDWSAFVSWFVLGNLGWLLIGTTTFFSLVVLTINTVVAQGEPKRT